MSVSAGQPVKSDRSFSDILTVVLSWNFAGTILALLFEETSRPDAAPVLIAQHFIDSFVYSNCIGTLLGFAVLSFTPRLMLQRFPLNWLLLAGLILGLTFVGSLLAGFTLMWLGIFPPRDYSWLTLRRMGLGFLLAVVFGVGAFFYESTRLRLSSTARRLRAKELAEERAQKLAVEASLSSLESRVRPHFLFNTLNSISSLIQEDPRLAERMVERLAALLRFTLDSGQRSTIPLEQELKIVVDYLEIERARFGARLNYRIEVAAELGALAVPPFVVQTLVENSVKHAVSRKRQGGEIRLRAREADGLVKIEVWDDGAGFTAEALVAGHGLDNLRARLAALFGGQTALDISRRENFTVVSVTLPRRLAKVEAV